MQIDHEERVHLIEQVGIIFLICGLMAILAIVLHQRLFQKRGDALLLLGAGWLLGLASFHIFPEVYHVGGSKMLIYAFVFLLIYTVLHTWIEKNGKHHHHRFDETTPCHHEIDTLVDSTLLTSIGLHSLADGALLGSASHFDSHLQHDILSSLVIHKVLEVLSVTSILLTRFKGKKLAIALCIYLFSFPLGLGIYELITHSLAAALSADQFHELTMATLSLSLGSLVACVLLDIVWPKLRQWRRRPRHLAWLLAGFLIMALVSNFKHQH